MILDDYHLLTSEAVQDVLHFLLDHLPARLHLVIGTRVDPPLPLARLRALSQLSELRTQELRFASAEVEAFARAMGLVLSGEATSLLELRTEGWIAGIQLLTLALRGHADLYEAQGRLRELGHLYDTIFQSFAQSSDPSPLFVALAHLRYAALLYEWNRLTEADSSVQQLMELGQRLEIPVLIPTLAVVGLWIRGRNCWTPCKNEVQWISLPILPIRCPSPSFQKCWVYPQQIASNFAPGHRQS